MPFVRLPYYIDVKPPQFRTRVRKVRISLVRQAEPTMGEREKFMCDLAMELAKLALDRYMGADLSRFIIRVSTAHMRADILPNAATIEFNAEEYWSPRLKSEQLGALLKLLLSKGYKLEKIELETTHEIVHATNLVYEKEQD